MTSESDGSESDVEVEQDDPDVTSLSNSHHPEPESLLSQVGLLDATVDRLHRFVGGNPDWTDVQNACENFARRPVVVTTVYTGAGGFEVGSNWVHASMQQCFQKCDRANSSRIIFYSGCEVAASPMQFIAEHVPEIRPRHLQKDLLDRLFASNRAKVTAILDIALDSYRKLKAKRRERKLGCDDFMTQKRRMEASLVRNLDLEFRHFHFQEKVECAICGGRCFVSPRSDPELSNYYWVECGGNSCDPWSMAGDRAGWLHAATLAAFTWAYSGKFFRPDSILQENSSNFDEAVFMQILCTEQVRNQPLSVFLDDADTASDSESELEVVLANRRGQQGRHLQLRYYHESETFNLIQLGLRVSRLRLYAAYHWEPRVARIALAIDWQGFYLSKSCARPDIYFCADDETIAFEQRARASAMRCVDQLGDNDLVDIETLTLTNGDFERLLGWDLQSRRSGLYEVVDGLKIWNVQMAIANVGQRSEYWGKIPTMHLPALLPRCVFFDLVRRRQISVTELWVAQGYPHPDVPELAHLAHHFPSPHLVSRKSSRRFDLTAQRKLIGNGMHVCAVGCWFLHQVSSHTLRF